MKTKYYRNRFGGFGIVEADSTITGDAVDLACCRTEKQAQELVQKLNSHDDLLAACQKTHDALFTIKMLHGHLSESLRDALAHHVGELGKVIARATGNSIPQPAISANLNQPL